MHGTMNVKKENTYFKCSVTSITRRTLVCYDSLTHLCHWHYVTVYDVPVYVNVILETTFVNACLLVLGATAPSGPWPPHSRGFYITHYDAAHSVGLLWTSDQLIAETSI